MSVIVSTPVQICNSPLNASKSKMLYTFPKAPRMGPDAKPLNPLFYDLPHVRSNRAASFGYGTKYDFTQGRGANPAPNAYALKDEIGTPGKKGFSFGLSREQMSVTGGAFVGDKKSPGPGAYDTRESNKTSLAFSFRPRTNSTEAHHTNKSAPGPGAYPLLETITPKGKMFISKYKSSTATVISPSRSQRFLEKLDGEKPGPGAYKVPGEISPSGSYFVSKFKTSVGKTFGLSLKKASSNADLRSHVPGPGTYKIPSDFGHYEAKNIQEPKSAQPKA